jgi:hypothetical protein
MKLASLVALRSATGILRLPSAELAEVLCCFWSYIGKKLHLDATQGFSWKAIGSQHRFSQESGSTWGGHVSIDSRALPDHTQSPARSPAPEVEETNAGQF